MFSSLKYMRNFMCKWLSAPLTGVLQRTDFKMQQKNIEG